MLRALAIYKVLIDNEHGYIEKQNGNEELFADYFDYEVSEALSSIAQAMDVRIFKGQKDRLYIVPLNYATNAIKESELKTYFFDNKKEKGCERSERVYLFYYTTLILLDEFFGGKPIRLKRDYLNLSEWINLINNVVARHKDLTIEEELKLGFNFIRVGRRWNALSNENDKTTAAINTKMGFLERVLLFLSKEELVITITEDETRIVPTEKLCDLIEKGNLKTYRIQEILNAELSHDNN